MIFSRHNLKNRSWCKKERKGGILNLRFLLGFLCLIGMVGSVLFAVQIAFASSKVASLETEEKNILSENKELEEKLIRGNSLTDLTSKAGQLGFSQLGEIVYLKQEKPMAKLP